MNTQPTGDWELLRQLEMARRMNEEPEPGAFVPITGALAPHQLINQTSGETEIYTPPEIVSRWQEVLGIIDLDPASSDVANRTIGARQIYTEPEFAYTGGWCANGLPIRKYANWGGLSHEWHGHTVINPPFGTPECACKDKCTKKRCRARGWHTATDLPGMPHWVNHFIGEYCAGRLTEGMILTFASTSEGWFQPLLQYVQCFPAKRTNYVLPDGTPYRGVTKGSCITYVGPNVEKFAQVFGSLGVVKVPFRG